MTTSVFRKQVQKRKKKSIQKTCKIFEYKGEFSNSTFRTIVAFAAHFNVAKLDSIVEFGVTFPLRISSVTTNVYLSQKIQFEINEWTNPNKLNWIKKRKELLITHWTTDGWYSDAHAPWTQLSCLIGEPRRAFVYSPRRNVIARTSCNNTRSSYFFVNASVKRMKINSLIMFCFVFFFPRAL